VVGLYRDIYGVQPKHNRLYLEPHLTQELSGTQLRYRLRNQLYLIDLNTEGSRMAVDDFAVRATGPFALSVKGDTAEFFPENLSGPALSLTRSRRAPVEIEIDARLTAMGWGRKWVESCASQGVVVRHVVSYLEPRRVYELRREGKKAGRFKADREGRLEFKATFDAAGPQRFELLIQ
jgi:hypothetical protein